MENVIKAKNNIEDVGGNVIGTVFNIQMLKKLLAQQFLTLYYKIINKKYRGKNDESVIYRRSGSSEKQVQLNMSKNILKINTMMYLY